MSLSEFFNTKNFNLQQVVTPCLGSKTSLLYFRVGAWLILMYGFVISVYNFYFHYNIDALRVYFPYFTNQTYLCVLFYFGLNIYFQIKDKKKALPLRFKTEGLNVFIHVFYNAIIPLSFLVSIIYWGVINPYMDFSRCTFLNYAQFFIQHTFQSLFLSIDWFLTSLPTSPHHLIPMLLVGLVYLLFAHIYHALYGYWIYDFVNTSNKYWGITYTLVISFWIALGYLFTLAHEKKNQFTSEVFSRRVGLRVGLRVEKKEEDSKNK